jgi:hypothetical protein
MNIFTFWNMTPCGPFKVNHISQEHVASSSGLRSKPSEKIFRKSVQNSKHKHYNLSDNTYAV